MPGLLKISLLALLLGVTGLWQSAQAQPSTDVAVGYAQLDQAALLALAQRGDAQAQFDLGSRYEDGQGVGQDDREAERWFKLAAEQGHPGAQAGLGALYALDLQDVPVDYAAALHWSRLAAEQKEVRGYYNLGVLYRDGLGVPQDNLQAIHWFSLAAEQGESWAQYNLGQLYASQESGVQDPALAVDWYLRAAEQGNPAAYHNLGAIFLEGQGVKSDPVLGYALIKVASLKAAPAESDEKAPADEVAKNFEMSDAQIAAGRDLARQLETSPRAGVQAYLSSTGNSVEAPADIGAGVRHAL